MKYSIEAVRDVRLAENISPNVIYNRFDLFANADCQLFRYTDQTGEYYFEVLLSGKSAKLGIWLMHLDSDALKRISTYVFRHYKSVRYVFAENSYDKFGSYKETNHFRIELPNSVEELDSRLSSKGRYNIKREKRILAQDFESYSVQKYDALSEDALPLWNLYFQFKKNTHDHRYHMTPQEYCDVFHVTTIYALHVGQEQKVIAMVLSCEQCPIVYIENLSYDTEFAKYSPGQVLYDEYLKLLLSERVKEIYLLGGDYDYKRRYGSLEETVYNCSLHRYEFLRIIKSRFSLFIKR